MRYEASSWLVPAGAWVGLGVFMAQSGLSCPARYLAPFYPLLIAPLLAGNGPQARLVRGAWFCRAGIGVFLLAGLLIVVCPSRPLWPAVGILRAFGANDSANPLVRRAWTVYSVYGQRADAFAPALAVLPPGADPLGVVTSDDPETSLWRPFGSRRIVHVCLGDTPGQLRQKHIKYVLVNSIVLAQNFQVSLDKWLAENNAELVQRLSLELRAGKGPVDWFLVRLN